MSVICPTITAFDTEEYRRQMNQVKPFAERVHIDLMDGNFAPTASPRLESVWWPHQFTADIHLMYREPEDCINNLIRLKPHLVIIHAEAQVDHMHFAAQLHAHDIETGLALLQETSVESTYQILHSFDHVLIFSGNLGYHGGEANLELLTKVKAVREHHPEAEISWDGGINGNNAVQLLAAGVDVLNVGGFIQKADDPTGAYAKLKAIIGND
jgi:ribulose-phosphate 3-epimerase